MNPQKKRKFVYERSQKKRGELHFLKYSPVPRYFIRPLASLLVRVFINTPVTPNQLTVTSFLIALAGSSFYLGGIHPYFIIGGLFIQTSQIFDSADGMLARAKNQQSHFGTYLDLFLDRISEFFLFGAIAIGYYRYSGNLTLLMIGIFNVGLLFLQTSLYYIFLNFRRDTKTGQTGHIRGAWTFLILIFSLINRLDFIIYGLLLYTTFSFFYIMVKFFRTDRTKGTGRDSIFHF